MKSIQKDISLKYLFMVLLSLGMGAASLALDRQPNADYRARRMALAQKMNGGVAILFAGVEAEGPNAVYGFRQDNNFYYLSGWAEPGAALIVVSEVAAKDNTPARPYTEILFLPVHNVAQEKWTGPKLGADNPQAPAITGFDRVENLDRMPTELARVLGKAPAAIYEDGESSTSVSAMDWLRRTNTFPMRTSNHDVKPLLAQLRVVKDE